MHDVQRMLAERVEEIACLAREMDAAAAGREYMPDVRRAAFRDAAELAHDALAAYEHLCERFGQINRPLEQDEFAAILLTGERLGHARALLVMTNQGVPEIVQRAADRDAAEAVFFREAHGIKQH